MSSPKNCSGCAKPFSSLRKPRAFAQHVFISTQPGSKGRIGAVAVALCGACRDEMKAAGDRPWALPAIAAEAENLERLVLADQPAGAPMQ